MTMSVTTAVVRPAVPVTYFLARLSSDRPSVRTDATRMTKSCTAPPRHAPMSSHRKPGRKPNCAASTGPMSGPAPAMAAKWWPKATYLLMGT